MIWLSLIGFLVSGLCAAFIIRALKGRRTPHYDDAKPQRFHIGEVPRMGGVALLLGLCVSWALGVVQTQAGDPGSLRLGNWAFFWIFAVLPAALGGIVEDMTQRMPIRYRLALTLLSGVLAVWLLDLNIPRLGMTWIDAWLVQAPWIGMAIVLLAITGLPHAFNIIDGYNGLAGMVALIISLALAHVCLQVNDRSLGSLIICLAAVTGGFLVWNYPRGMLFAGDGGAYIWGVVIAMVSISLVQRNPDVSPWFPVLLLIYPIWETLFSIYRKLARGVAGHGGRAAFSPADLPAARDRRVP